MPESSKHAEAPRDVLPVEEGRIYDVLIVGAGPAGLSAALYAARKNLQVALVTENVGGQLTYTAQVDNYLGFPGIRGDELMRQFRTHAESYPLTELVGVGVREVKGSYGGFLIRTDDGRELAAHSVVYCAGREYTRLGVPNEERLVGRGVAFCATCDAPLYRDLPVAVVGGGNSALTAVRDLLTSASEVHLIHRRDVFTADATLVDEIKGDPQVTFHTPYQVLSFVGDQRLRAVEIVSIPEGERTTLEVDGVFLEIGLSPNTEPVEGLVQLSNQREISVDAAASTELAGFFAAGDVTDIPEKQISVAVGQGALAALSAYQYLVEKGLVARRVRLEAEWA